MFFSPQTKSIQGDLGNSKDSHCSFTQDEAGGITIFVLIMSVLLLVAGGMAVDFQRQELARADLQNALDRGVLAATNNYHEFDTSGTLTLNEQAEQVILDYIASRNYQTAGLNLSVNVVDAGGKRVVTASANHPVETVFLRMMGLSALGVNVNAGAVYAAPKLEITLVLDVSGSMGSNSTSAPGTKLAQLQVAAKQFIDTILDADSAAQTLISIVPFSQQVNLPRAMADVYNIDRTHDYSSCIDFHEFDFQTTAMTLSHTSPTRPWEQGQHFIENNAGRANVHYGCPRLMNAVTPFSNNPTQLKTAIDALASESWTATYLGVKWGAALLDPTSRPVVDAMIASGDLSANFAGWPHAWSDPSVRKITVVMSDGKNTKLNEIVPVQYSAHTPAYWNQNAPTSSQKISIIDNDNSVTTDPDGTRRGQGDRLLKDICEAARIGVNSTIYTIGFELAGEPIAIAALDACASSPTTAYLVEGVDITTAFQNIADEIVNLKLTN